MHPTTVDYSEEFRGSTFVESGVSARWHSRVFFLQVAVGAHHLSVARNSGPPTVCPRR